MRSDPVGATRRAVVSGLLALACATATAPGNARADDAHGYSDQDYNACLDCHENSGILGISETKHFDFDDPKSPAALEQCQSCHGPSARHMQFPMQVANVHFGKGSKAAATTQNRMCLECHDDGERAGWQMSPHGLEDVLCNTCHAIHQPDRIVPSKAATTGTCADSCHTDLVESIDSDGFSHKVEMHPSDDDAFTCATCHNPHGPLDSVRCLECHEQDEATLAQQTAKAQRFHATARARDIDCVRCHKGLAHPIPPLLELRAKQSIEEAEAAQR